MNRTEYFLLLLALGSLWGFFEMISLPVFILCSIGLLFLFIGRKLVDIPGTSIIIGLIVCFYKTYGNNFFICQWAGVMGLAISFDFYASFIFKSNWQKPIITSLIGIITNITSLFIFVFVVVVVFQEPNWLAGGLDRIINYTLYSILPAAIISGLLTSHIGSYVGSKLKGLNAVTPKKILPGIYLTATILLWIAASIN
ncbi:MAG: hypothetical protein AB1521_12050 [Bacteroidota bacterium]